jgi:hypothetical protein
VGGELHHDVEVRDAVDGLTVQPIEDTLEGVHHRFSALSFDCA